MIYCEQVRAALKAYKAGTSPAQQLIDVVVGVLRVPSRQHLLPGFEQLLSRSQRKWLHTCLACTPPPLLCVLFEGKRAV